MSLCSQGIFFGGVDPSIRGEVWPFLLHYYSYDSTSEEREAWRLQKREKYQEIQQRRLVKRLVLAPRLPCFPCYSLIFCK